MSGFQGDAAVPLVGFSVETLAAFNRRTVDLWGVGERWHLPDEGSNNDMFAWLRWVQYRSQPSALGDTTGERSSPLVKIVWYYHTHLAALLNGVRWLKEVQRKRVT